MNYSLFYDLVIEEETRLKRETANKRAEGVSADYRRCKALAACYELQEHLAGRLAEDEEADLDA